MELLKSKMSDIEMHVFEFKNVKLNYLIAGFTYS
jgi:hypothetical protein